MEMRFVTGAAGEALKKNIMVDGSTAYRLTGDFSPHYGPFLGDIGGNLTKHINKPLQAEPPLSNHLVGLDFLSGCHPPVILRSRTLLN